MRKAWFVLFFVSGLCINAQVLVDKVVAMVGKHPILLSQVEIGYREKLAEDSSISKCSVLEELMFQKLLLMQAEKDSVTVTDNEVDAEIGRRLAYYINMFGSQEKFEEFYGKKVNVFKDEVRPEVKDQLIIQKMQQKIVGDIKISPSEVQLFYNSIPQDSLPLIPMEYEWSQIVIQPKVSLEAKMLAREQIESYRKRVLNGESMSVLAALYSEDPGSAKNGGRYDNVARGMMVPEFESVAFKLKPGEVSEVFESPYGFHFIQLIARKGELVDLRHILIIPKIQNIDVYKAKQKADSIYNAIENGSLSFEKAVQLYSDDKDTKQNNGVMVNPNTSSVKWGIEDISHLDQNLVVVFEKMKSGEITRPIQYMTPDNKPAFRIIKLNNVTLPHRANMKDDYQKLAQLAQLDKQKKLIKKWIAQKSAMTYIKIDNELYHCNFSAYWKLNN
ncbi:MAG: peptidylprolyl isomerase [Bacteroidia bacterium]|nr:MAG: peptidylprolyl isomerase [Bacteroidia bacterium]